MSIVDVIYCYGDIGIKTIVIHSLLLFILSSPDRLFIYLCHPFHSSPHVFLIMLLFSPLVQLFLLYNYHQDESLIFNARVAISWPQLDLEMHENKNSVNSSIMPEPSLKNIANRKKITLASAI